MRILAISDIHGCIVAFKTLLMCVRPEPEDLVITLGDYVDRGPASAAVLDRMIELHQTRQVISLRGNHDLTMLRVHQGRFADELRFWMAIGGKETLASYPGGSIENIPQKHWDFLGETCRDWHETDTHVFVHAYVAPHLPMERQPEEELFWRTLSQWAPRHQSGKTIVCAHTVSPKRLPLNLGHAVCLETAAYADDGWLTCLDVLTGSFWQANERGDMRTGRLW
jgi:serine/threonine protein phosphatase 1